MHGRFSHHKAGCVNSWLAQKVESFKRLKLTVKGDYGGTRAEARRLINEAATRKSWKIRWWQAARVYWGEEDFDCVLASAFGAALLFCACYPCDDNSNRQSQATTPVVRKQSNQIACQQPEARSLVLAISLRIMLRYGASKAHFILNWVLWHFS